MVLLRIYYLIVCINILFAIIDSINDFGGIFYATIDYIYIYIYIYRNLKKLELALYSNDYYTLIEI